MPSFYVLISSLEGSSRDFISPSGARDTIPVHVQCPLHVSWPLVAGFNDWPSMTGLTAWHVFETSPVIFVAGCEKVIAPLMFLILSSDLGFTGFVQGINLLPGVYRT